MLSSKNIIFFAGGVIFGSVLTFFGVRGHFKKQSNREIDEFLKDFYESEGATEGDLDSDSDEKSGDDEDLKEDEPENDENLYEKALNLAQEYVDPAESAYPSDDSDEYLSEEEREMAAREELIREGGLITEENENDIAGEAMTNEMNSGRKPKLITESDYYDDYRHFDKVILEYYTGDDVLIDTTDEQEVFDEARVVGDCLDKYGFRHNDEEIIYVRNYSFGTDYEISKIFGSFYSEEE